MPAKKKCLKNRWERWTVVFSGGAFFQDLDAHSKLEDGAIDLTLRLEVIYGTWTMRNPCVKVTKCS